MKKSDKYGLSSSGEWEGGRREKEEERGREKGERRKRQGDINLLITD